MLEVVAAYVYVCRLFCGVASRVDDERRVQLGHVITVLHVVRDDPLAIAWQSTDGLHLRVQIAAAAALDATSACARSASAIPPCCGAQC